MFGGNILLGCVQRRNPECRLAGSMMVSEKDLINKNSLQMRQDQNTLFKKVFPLITSPILDRINLSLVNGYVPQALGLHSNDLFEEFSQVSELIHSTETARLKVTNDILLASD
ncbi:hypothetical protein ATANTOWER_029204 [Ataeniobius toweri]|uniref:Uncharacterized protein n=1 Tax=Ataeniobius toweri TaxID=208326 RepID=A0ABU7AJF0_9TELE|nr:hypothetical protein [Ataeniobius toweri]